LLKNYLPIQRITDILKTHIDESLIKSLLTKYEGLLADYRIDHFEAVLVKTGKIVELFYRVLDYLSRGSYNNSPSMNKIDERLQILVSKQAIEPSIANLIPKSLRNAYKLRNSRDGAHISDIVANRVDAEYAVHIIQWSIAELVRCYSNLKPEDCLNLIETILELPVPIIQRLGEEIVILEDMSAKSQLLVILYFSEMKSMETNRLINMIKDKTRNNVKVSWNNCINSKLIYETNDTSYLTRKGEQTIIKKIRGEHNSN